MSEEQNIEPQVADQVMNSKGQIVEHTPKKGLKQQIKDGEISPSEAIQLVLNSEGHSVKFVRWARETGPDRYNKARLKKEVGEPVGPKNKKSKKRG